MKPQQSIQPLHVLLSRACHAGEAETGAAASAVAVLLVERLAAGLVSILLPPESASQPAAALPPPQSASQPVALPLEEGDGTATKYMMGLGSSASSVCPSEHLTLTALSTAGPESVEASDVSDVLVLLSSALTSMTGSESDCREIESLLPRLAALLCSCWGQACRPVLGRAKGMQDFRLGGGRSALSGERLRRVGISMEGVLQQLKHAAQAAAQQTHAQAQRQQQQQQPDTAVAASSPGSLESLCLSAAVAMAGALYSGLLLQDAVSAADLAKEGLQELLKIRLQIRLQVRLHQGAVPVLGGLRERTADLGLETGAPMSQGPCEGPVEFKDRAGPASSQLLQVDAPPPPPPPPSPALGVRGAEVPLPHADDSRAFGLLSTPVRNAGRRLRYLRKELVGLRTSCQPSGELAEALFQDDNSPFLLPV